MFVHFIKLQLIKCPRTVNVQKPPDLIQVKMNLRIKVMDFSFKLSSDYFRKCWVSYFIWIMIAYFQIKESFCENLVLGESCCIFIHCPSYNNSIGTTLS